MRKSQIIAGLMLTLAAACGSSEEGADSDGFEGKVNSDGTIEVPVPESGIQLAYGPFPVPQFEEIETCKYLKVPEDMLVTRFFSRMREGSHHLIVFYTEAADFPDGEYPCIAGARRDIDFDFRIMLQLQTVYTSQTKAGELVMPEGLAFQMKKGAQLVINSHYINYGEDEALGEILLNIETVSPDTSPELAQPMFFLNPAIDLAPGATGELGLKCGMPEGAIITTLSSHTHQYGTGFEIWRHRKEAAEDLDLLYNNDDWAHPEFINYDPPITLAADEVFRFECQYHNTSDRRVGFGNESTDEMCIMLGYYYIPGSRDPRMQFCLDGLLEILPAFLD